MNEEHESIDRALPDLPPGMKSIVTKSLQKDLTDRYFDASEFAYALETFAFENRHMVGPRVTELLGEAVTALGFEADLKTWSEVVHPHPSLSEAMGEAIAAAAGRPVHGG